MTLKQEIEAFVADTAGRMPPELITDIERSIEDVRASGILERALSEGGLAPPFTLPNASGKPVSLRDYLRRGPVIITFYRGVWCPYCNLELQAYQRLLPEIRAAGGDLTADARQLRADDQQQRDRLRDPERPRQRRRGRVWHRLPHAGRRPAHHGD